MLGDWRWALSAERRVLGVGCWVLGVGCWVLGARAQLQTTPSPKPAHVAHLLLDLR